MEMANGNWYSIRERLSRSAFRSWSQRPLLAQALPPGAGRTADPDAMDADHGVLAAGQGVCYLHLHWIFCQQGLDAGPLGRRARGGVGQARPDRDPQNLWDSTAAGTG